MSQFFRWSLPFPVKWTTLKQLLFQDDEEDKAESDRLNNRRVIEAHVHLPDGDVFPIHAAIFVIASGAESGHIAHLVKAVFKTLKPRFVPTEIIYE